MDLFCWHFIFRKRLLAGFKISDSYKSEWFYRRICLWQEITSIKYESVYNIHGVSLQLSIFYGTPQKAFHLQVEQYNKKKMERFFEMLNEQCPFAEKNDHFIKKATGVMGWKDKLKMY